MKKLMDEDSYRRSLPKKRMGAGVVFQNTDGQYLFVKTTYKDHWTLPGGVVDSGESPYDACIREVKEEIGLKIGSLRFICVDYRSYPEEKDESLQFLFYGGILTSKDIEAIVLQDDEISGFTFFKLKSNLKLSRGTKERMSFAVKAIKNGKSYYLENGKLL